MVSFAKTVHNLCSDAVNYEPQKISLLGLPGDPVSNIRTIVSRYNRQFSTDLQTKFDPASGTATISVRVAKPKKVAAFVAPANVPPSLFAFLNGNRSDVESIREFSNLLISLLADHDSAQTDLI